MYFVGSWCGWLVGLTLGRCAGGSLSCAEGRFELVDLEDLTRDEVCKVDV